MATVEDLYRQVLGREPDPEGLAFWKSAFGGSVDPTEQASFMQSVQSVLASAPAAQQATLAPKLVAEATATGVPVTTVAASVPPPPAAPVAPAAPVDPTVKLFQDTLGRAPTQGEIERFGGDIKEGQLSNFLGYARNQVVNTMPTSGAVGNIASQILAQGTTDKWGGEGFGSATKNAYDMATMLAGQGIKDINDFGQRTNASGEKEFFNKATGEAIKPFYDRAGDNIWGGTFAGTDSTAYGVEFDASGKPLFYSQYGGDSADVPSWVVPALVLGGAYFGLGGLEGLFGGAGAGTAGSLTAGITAADIAASDALLSGLTASQAASIGAAGGLGAGFTTAGLPSGVGTFLGENVVSGIPAWDTAFTTAGGMFNSAFGLPAGNGAFLGEGVPSGVPAWDAAYTAAGGVFDPAFALGPDGLVGTPLTPVTTPPTTTTTPPTTTPPIDITNIPPSLITAILGGVVAPKVLNPTTPTPTGVGALPTQGVPLNTADYYRAIQQNYNRLLPAVPRDVATPLAQWYNSTYGA